MEPTTKGWSITKDDWQWNAAKALVDRYDLIAYEDLRVGNMMRNHSLARAIQDASWSGFWDKVDWKAKRKGVLTVAVDPEYSTQECPVCHAKHEVALSDFREDVRVSLVRIRGAEGFQGGVDHTTARPGRDGHARIHACGDTYGGAADRPARSGCC